MAGTLTVHDHTLVVGAVMGNVFPIIGELEVLDWIAGKRKRPTHREMIDATVGLKAIDANIRAKVRTARDTVLDLQQAIDALPRPVRSDLEEAADLVVGSRSMKGLRRNLDRVERRHPGTPMAEGVQIARQLIEDGKDSIYDFKDNPFYQIGGKEPVVVLKGVKEVVKTDAAGAIIGAGIGIAGGPGGVGGAAAAGACVASATAVVEAVLDEVWPDDEEEVPLFDSIGDYFGM